MANCTAVFLDVTGIQEYVFSSNKMRENLGASFLVKYIYSAPVLGDAIRKATGDAIDLEEWKETQSDITELKKTAKVGYIGGGKALLFFQNADQAEDFIYHWTREVFCLAPGITTLAASEPFGTAKFAESFKHLFQTLQKNKSLHKPQVELPRHGITAECRLSGLGMEIWNARQKDYVSAVSNARINAGGSSTGDSAVDEPSDRYPLDARRRLEDDFKDCLGDEYCFTNELHQLGSNFGEESKIAVVHIDGNDIGQRFSAVRGLKELQRLAIGLQQSNFQAMQALITHIVGNYDKIMTGLGFNPKPDSNTAAGPPVDNRSKKRILPVLPLIYGGDDITLVCDGRLGIYFAEYFIKQLEAVDILPNLTACAGIAVINYKYPFYRGYKLSEQLCKSGKDERRKKLSQYKDSSFIDFHITGSGLSGPLHTIRKNHYRAPQGELLQRPLTLGVADTASLLNFPQLLRSAAEISTFPNSVIHDLLKALNGSEAEGANFIQHCEFRNRRLPTIKNRSNLGQQALFENRRTPYFDMIELLEVYPSWALKELQNTNGGMV